MDKKDVIIALLTIIIILLVVFGFIIVTQNGVDDSRKNNIDGKLNNTIPANEKNASEDVPPIKAPTIAEGISINELIAKNKPVKCALGYKTNAEAPQSDAIYIAAGRAKMDMDMGNVAEAENIASHTLTMDGFQYSWTDGGNLSKGTKINLEAIAKDAPEAFQATRKFGLDVKFDITCFPWTVDEQVFTLPASVTFEDMTEQTIKMLQSPSTPPASPTTAPVPPAANKPAGISQAADHK
jgi:hypothetical protein